MDPNPKQHEEVGTQTTGAEILTEMPSFDEHMKNVEREMPVAEKYYEQARAKKNEWIGLERKKIEYAKSLKVEDITILTNFGAMIARGEEPARRHLSAENADDVARFNEFQANEIERAEDSIQQIEDRDMDQLAKYCRNQEIINQIAAKLKSGEEYSPEELEFLGDIPKTLGDGFSCTKYHSIEVDDYVYENGLMAMPLFYSDFIGRNMWEGTSYAIVAQAQFDRMQKRDGGLLLNNEDVQKALDGMEARRAENPFFGETNINRATGEERTFTLEDNYPQLDGETANDYASRIKRIGLKTRLAEKRQEQ